MIEMDILLGESITLHKTQVQVLAARPGHVKLGFEAPPQVCIVRSELLRPPLRRKLQTKTAPDE